MKQFENLTIGQLRKLTVQYQKMEKELKFLKQKYPSRAKELNKKEPQTAQEVIDELNKK